MNQRTLRAALLLTCAAAPAGWAQSLPPSSELKDPAGQRILLRLETLPGSVQIYTCKPKTEAAKEFAWAGPDPDAVLTNSGKTVIVHHYKGPAWEATDGSLVRGSNARHYAAPHVDSVDWLELSASAGSGHFAGMTYIHRLDTSGGTAPPGVCDQAHGGEQVRVPYKANYVFYKQ